MLALLQVSERAHHGLHPRHAGAQVRGVGEVVVPQSLLELLCHLLEICKVAGSLFVGVMSAVEKI